ncbi:MAG: beta-ketoacyl-[acyl-carrier-protein] synthase family protein [Brumimicrobium sp.]|nr:beta-ketoacyl-[acyl-carrier-protein] synthase family protein [Brumimicrobium sp.]
MHKRIAITGMGMISSIGMNVKENLQSLLAIKHGISRIENVPTRLADSIFVGEIKKTNEELIQQLGIPKLNDYSRTAMLGRIAIQEAIQCAGLTKDDLSSIGFINSTSVGGMDVIEQYYKDFLHHEEHRHYVDVHDAGSNTELIAQDLGIEGYVTTISTACSSAANAIMMGARLIEAGRIDKVIVGGMDALCKFTMNGFNTLMILSDTYNQPFDDNRKGLNLGEGAAYLILESDKSVQERGAKAIAYLAGYANSNDAFHQTASSENGEGAYLAMKEALAISGLSINDIDYVNVHGTATPNNDLSEGRAMIQLFGNHVPPFSSTKPFTGHTLATAASVEAIYSIFALQKGIILPNLNFQTKMQEFDLIPETQISEKKINAVMSNSFGFGGNCSSLIFCN